MWALWACSGPSPDDGGAPNRDVTEDAVDDRDGRLDGEDTNGSDMPDGSGDADSGDLDDSDADANLDVADTSDGSGDVGTDTDDRLCSPGVRSCVDEQNFHRCNVAGDGYEAPEACAEDRYCADGLCLASECLPAVMFVVDGSSGMFDECVQTPGPVWDPIRGPIATVIEENDNVAFGLSMFPVSLGCSIGDGSSTAIWPDVAIRPDAADPISTWFDDHGPSCGASPIVQTLEWFAENAGEVWREDAASKYLVLATDGAEICRCSRDDIECQTEKLGDAVGALFDLGIRTYVIGYRYDDAPEVLTAIAEAGGTSLAEFVRAEDAGTLTDAFQVIIDDAKLCAD